MSQAKSGSQGIDGMSGGPPPQQNDPFAPSNGQQQYGAAPVIVPPQPVGSPPPNYISPQGQPYAQVQQVPLNMAQPGYPSGQQVYFAPQHQQQSQQPMYVMSPQATGVDQFGQPVYSPYVAAPQPTMVMVGSEKAVQPQAVHTTTIVREGGAGTTAAAAGGGAAGGAVGGAVGGAAGGAVGGAAGGCCGACCGALAACCCCCTVM